MAPEPLYPQEDTYLDEGNFSPEQKLLHAIRGVEGNHYAWGRMARLLCEDDYYKAYQATSGNFVAVDLFSSFPIFPQIMRERYRDRCFGVGQQMVRDAVSALQSHQDRLRQDLRIPASELLSDEQKKVFRIELNPRKSYGRQLMQTAIADVLYDPPSLTNDEHNNTEALKQKLLRYFRSSTILFGTRHEGLQIDGKGQWQTIKRFQIDKTLFGVFTQLLNSPDKSSDQIADQVYYLMDDLAALFARQCLPIIRSHKVISIDMQDLAKLLEEGRKSFPAEFTNTAFFQRASDFTGDKHIICDGTVLPFGSNTISFYSSVEGALPFYAHSFPHLYRTRYTNKKTGLENDYEVGFLPFAASLASSLKPGGRAVFFPWHIQHSDPEDKNNLTSVERFWRESGLEVEKRVYTREYLVSEMRFREQILTEHSPVFTDHRRKNFTALVVAK